MSLAGFDWDEGNTDKCRKHGMTLDEIESVLRAPALTFPDKPNDAGEERFRAIGKTYTGRNAFVIYTIREIAGKSLVRPISARFMHQKEAEAYEKAVPTSQQ